MGALAAWVAVALTVSFNVYGQVTTKRRILRLPPMAGDAGSKLRYMARLLRDPWILSAYLGALLAALCWIAAMTRLPLSLAYPFTSLSFVLIIGLGAVMFDERIQVAHVIGTALVITGLVFIACA